jgi:hypothetical protein
MISHQQIGVPYLVGQELVAKLQVVLVAEDLSIKNKGM